MVNNFVLEVRNISKVFNISSKDLGGVLTKIVDFFNGSLQQKEFVALKDISFNLEKGKNLGIIGRNGSGKSTLLRVISGIYSLDSGTILTKGKLLYLNGFNQGLRPRLTMRENIYLVATIMGLTKEQINKIFEEIVDFSELRSFLDTKVYQFSSGMIARLNFSIGINCLYHHNPDILLLDEVFGSGGDIIFQKKALEKMNEFLKGGTAVVMVSHDLNLIKKYCRTVIWLEKGKIIADGKANKIVDDYKKKFS